MSRWLYHALAEAVTIFVTKIEKTIYKHLMQNGISRGYTTWNYHGEESDDDDDDGGGDDVSFDRIDGGTDDMSDDDLEEILDNIDESHDEDGDDDDIDSTKSLSSSHEESPLDDCEHENINASGIQNNEEMLHPSRQKIKQKRGEKNPIFLEGGSKKRTQNEDLEDHLEVNSPRTDEENPSEQSRLGIFFSKEIFEGGVIRIHNAFVHDEDHTYGKVACIAHKLKGKVPVRGNQDWCFSQFFLECLKGFNTLFGEEEWGIFLKKTVHRSGYLQKILYESSIKADMTKKATDTLDGSGMS
nr:hypothetical protein [Tanacetum cinerariifolium]